LTEQKRFTDLVVTVDGALTMSEMDDFYERALAWGRDTGHYEPTLSAHESNADGETYHSMKTERDALLRWFKTLTGDEERLDQLKVVIESWLRHNHTHVATAHCRICDERTAALAEVVDRWAAG